MWTTSIALPIENTVMQDSSGFLTQQKTYLQGIPASMLDSTRQDELLANAQGYRADVVVEIDKAAYNGASFFVDEATGAEYDIRRTFLEERANTIRLTGQRREYGKIGT